MNWVLLFENEIANQVLRMLERITAPKTKCLCCESSSSSSSSSSSIVVSSSSSSNISSVSSPSSAHSSSNISSVSSPSSPSSAHSSSITTSSSTPHTTSSSGASSSQSSGDPCIYLLDGFLQEGEFGWVDVGPAELSTLVLYDTVYYSTAESYAYVNGEYRALTSDEYTFTYDAATQSGTASVNFVHNGKQYTITASAIQYDDSGNAYICITQLDIIDITSSHSPIIPSSASASVASSATPHYSSSGLSGSSSSQESCTTTFIGPLYNNIDYRGNLYTCRGLDTPITINDCIITGDSTDTYLSIFDGGFSGGNITVMHTETTVLTSGHYWCSFETSSDYSACSMQGKINGEIFRFTTPSEKMTLEFNVTDTVVFEFEIYIAEASGFDASFSFRMFRTE